MVGDHSGQLRLIRSGLTMLVTPFQFAVNWPIDTYHSIRYSVSSSYELQMENETLRSKQLLLEAKLQKLLALEKQNESLKALLQSSVYVHGKTMVASILSVSLAPFSQQVIVDKGSHHGIFVGQPVLDAFGVMGQVISVTPFTSRVLLITDQQSAIPVQNNRNGLRAIVQGKGYAGTMDMLYAPDTADFQKGDMLITSGLGERYPSDYPLGVIKEVSHESGMRFAKIIVEPKAHLNSSKQVLLVWPEHLQSKKLSKTKTAPKKLTAHSKSKNQSAHAHINIPKPNHALQLEQERFYDN